MECLYRISNSLENYIQIYHLKNSIFIFNVAQNRHFFL